MYVPQTYNTTGYGTVGGQPFNYSQNTFGGGSFTQLSCTLRVFVDEGGRITNWDGGGNNGACLDFSSRLKNVRPVTTSDGATYYPPSYQPDRTGRNKLVRCDWGNGKSASISVATCEQNNGRILSDADGDQAHKENLSEFRKCLRDEASLVPRKHAPDDSEHVSNKKAATSVAESIVARCGYRTKYNGYSIAADTPLVLGYIGGGRTEEKPTEAPMRLH